MAQRTLGVLATRHIWVGVVEDHALIDTSVYPEPGRGAWDPRALPADGLAAVIREQIARAVSQGKPAAIGLGFPGIIHAGVVEECPNLPQMKGFDLQASLDMGVPVRVLNRTDAMAAGIAATRGQLEKVIRVWYLGDGIGFGRYPLGEGVWEAGHSVVSLDPKERFCGCGGQGHLEGIMGYRSMRLRFLDLEPEEVFENAKSGDERCVDFVRLWHRALAAASATSICLDGPGRFYLLGPNAEFVDLHVLNLCVQDMVKMSSLQNNSFEVIESAHEVALIGAAVTAGKAASREG